MSIEAESLFAVTGLSKRGPIEETDTNRAAKLPEQWARKFKAFIGQGKPEKFEMPPDLDVMAMWEKLAVGPDETERQVRIGFIQDGDLQRDYLAVWERASTYARDHWPATAIETGFGSKQLPPSAMQELEARSIYRAVDSPTAMLDELLQGVLTSETVEAVSSVFPELSKMLTGIAQDEFVARISRDSSWEPEHRKDLLLRVLFGLPTDAKIAEVVTHDGEPRSERAPSAPKLDYADKLRTKGQQLAAQ